MEFWFSELHSPHVKFDIRVEKQLFSGESDYQRIDVFQSPEFGNAYYLFFLGTDYTENTDSQIFFILFL